MKKALKNRFIILLLALFALSILFAVPSVINETYAAGNTEIVIASSLSEVKTNSVGQEVIVSATVKNSSGTNLLGAQVKLSFDVKCFEFVSFNASREIDKSDYDRHNSNIDLGYITIMGDNNGEPISNTQWLMGSITLKSKAALQANSTSDITASEIELLDTMGEDTAPIITGGSISIKFTEPSTACDITSFSVNGSALTASGNVYTYNAPYTYRKLEKVNCQVSAGAKAVFSPALNGNLQVGENTVAITVTAEDGSTKKTYTLKVNRAEGEKVNTLSNLTFKSNGTALLTKTSADLTAAGTYDAGKIAFADKDKLSLEFAKNGTYSTAEVLLDGVKKSNSSPYNLGVISSGKHTVSVKVSPQQTEGTTVNEYKVDFEVEAPEGKATLSDLSLKIVKEDGEEPVNFAETFSPNVLNYSASVPRSTTKIKIEATASGELATVSGVGEFEVTLPCSMVVKVTAQSGDFTDYTIVIATEKDVSGLTLKNLSAVGIESDGTEHVLDMSLTSVADYYKVSIPFSLNISEFMIKADRFTNPDYTVEGINYKVSIVRGDMPKIHEVRFVKNDVAEKIVVFDIFYESDVVSLEKLTYDGKEIELDNKTDFALEFGVSVDSVRIGAVATDRNATVTIISTRNSKSGSGELNVELFGGLNLVIVKVTATNGNVGFYTLTLTRLQSGVKTLQSLDLGGTKMDVTDNMRVYEMEVGADVDKISIKAGAVAGATVSIDYADVAEEISSGDKIINLKSGSNVVLVKVTAEDGSVGVYTVSVTRKIDKADTYTPYVVAIVVISVVSVLIIIALTVVIIVNRRRG